MSRYIALGVIGITLAIAYGIWYAYSVILVALLGEFGWSRSVLAGAFSMFTLAHGAFNPVCGTLCTRYRPLRVSAAGGGAMGAALFLDSFISTPLELYLLFGVVTAVAVSAAGWIPALVHVQREFQDRLGFAIGIVSSGVGVGILLIVPLTQVLIDAYGWRVAFRVLALISVVWIVPANLWLMRRAESQNRGQSPMRQNREKSGSDPKPREKSGSDPKSQLTLREAARTQPFWLIVAAFFFGNLCSQTLHVHQMAYLVDHGLSAMLAATVVGAVGAASIVGKTGGGWLSDRMDRELVYAAGIAILVSSAFALLAIGNASPAWAAYGYAVLLGIGYSVTATITPAMMSDRFGGRHFGAIVGAGLFASAAGSAVGPWLAGRAYDAIGSYTVPFLAAAGCGIAAGAAGLRARALRKAF